MRHPLAAPVGLTDTLDGGHRTLEQRRVPEKLRCAHKRPRHLTIGSGINRVVDEWGLEPSAFAGSGSVVRVIADLTREEAAVCTVDQRVCHILNDLDGAVAIARRLEDDPALEKESHRTRVDAEELLAVRMAPVSALRVAKDTTLNLIEQPPPPDGVERVSRHLPQRLVTLFTPRKHKPDRRLLEALGCPPKAPVDRVERVAQVGDEPRFEIQIELRDGAHAFRRHRRAPGRVRDRAELCAPRGIRSGDPLQELGHPCWVGEGLPTEQLAVRRQKGGRRPPTEVVAIVDVWSVVGVDPDRNEIAVDQPTHGVISIGRAKHLGGSK